MSETIEYPITTNNLNKDAWNRRVNATLMMSFGVQDQTIPVLLELTELLTRMLSYRLEQTLFGKEVQQFVFVNVLPPICRKLIASKQFKHEQVLQLSNGIIESCVEIYKRFPEQVWQYPKFAELIVIVFDPDATYFRKNNQIEQNRSYVFDQLTQPWQFFPVHQHENPFLKDLQPGGTLDAIKYQLSIKKACWSRAKLVQRAGNELQLSFLNDVRDYSRNVAINSVEIAPLGTRSLDFEWRMQLKSGDLLDCCDSYGSWYAGTVVTAREAHNGGKVVRVGFRVYCEDGEKYDSKGKYYGLAETFDEDNIDVTSPRIQKPGTIAKPRQYVLGKHHSDYLNDFNDLQFQSINGERITYIPRPKFMSMFLFRVVRSFIKDLGYSQLIKRLVSENNWDVLVAVVSSLGNLSQNLHKMYARELSEQLKPIIHKHLIDDSELNMKRFSRDKSQCVFKGMKALIKRNNSQDDFKEYQNSQKLQLTLLCLGSQTLKRRIQGMGQLKDIIKGYKYTASKIPQFIEWLKQSKILSKVYLNNTHVQLIKRSTEYFRFLIVEGGLTIDQLSQMFRAAQKGDYETKLSYYKLFQEVSHNFKKDQTNYLIDGLLETEISSVTSEDIDLLYELSKYSNYFPIEKVIPFLEKILLFGKVNQQLHQACLKKYTDIVNKNNRKATIEKFVLKLKNGDDNPQTLIKILRNILDFTSYSQYYRYDIPEILQLQRFDSIILKNLKKIKNQSSSNAVYLSAAQKILGFLSWIGSMSAKKVKVGVDTLVEMWNQMVKNKKNNEEKELFYSWAVEVCSGDLLAEPEEDAKDYYQEFFLKLTSEKELSQLNAKGFELIKYLFLNINRKGSSIYLTTIVKNSKQIPFWKVRVPLYELKFYPVLIDLIYRNPELSSHALTFLTTLYTSQDLTVASRAKYFQSTLADFFKFFKNGDYDNVSRNIEILECIIDESEKDGSGDLRSLGTMKKGEPVTLEIVNQMAYVIDSMRKPQLKTYANITLFDLRRQLGKMLAVHWQQLRISQKQQLPEILNNRTLKDLKIKLNESLTVSKKPTYLIPSQPLLIDRKLNPKAAVALGKVFKRFSTEGQMHRQQCRQFIGSCVGDTTKLYDDRLVTIFKQYDTTNRGYLILQNILDFFEAAAVDRAHTVSNNMRHLGIRHDFKCYDDVQQDVKKEDLPRYHLSRNQDFYESLFKMLDCEEKVARGVWKLLERLPISNTLYEAIITIKEGANEKWQMLDLSLPYRMLYCLYVFEYLADSDESELHTNERQWKENFIKANGYEYLFELFTKLTSKQSLKAIEKNIVQFILKMLSKYLISCFCSREIGLAYTILHSQLDFDNLLNYLKTSQIPKNASNDAVIQYSKLASPKKVAKTLEWKGVGKNEIIEVLVKFIDGISAEASTNDIQRAGELEHCFSIMLCLLADSDATPLLGRLQTLLSKPLSSLTQQRIFKLLIALCKACPEKSKTPLSLIEWLFSIRSTSPSYFKTLALLVKQYGMPETIHDAPQRLMESILQTQNEHVIEGCSKLLTQMKLDWVDEDLMKKVWYRCMFGRGITCKGPLTRQCVYDLLAKIAQSKPELTGPLVKLVTDTLEPAMSKSKVVTSNDLQNRSVFGYAGLKNIGNICYMLAMIQQMYHNPSFRSIILRIDDHKPADLQTYESKTYDDNLLHQLRRMFAYLHSTQRMDFAPFEFCLSFKSHGNTPIDIKIQQDAQQFVSMMIDQLEKFIKDTPFKHVLENFYGGKTCNMLTCDQCHQVSQRQENFYCLSVEVKNSKTLAESFNKFILGEIINDYRCDFCNRKSDVSKKTVISKCPSTLIVHLQRIVFNHDTFINEKINTKLQFPMQFNLQPYTVSANSQPPTDSQQPTQYQLVGVIAHYGTAQFGHYYSFIKTQQQQWLEFNDSRVSGFDLKNLDSQCFGGQAQALDFFDDEYDIGKKDNSKNAYMLVYQRKKREPVQLVFDDQKQMQQVMEKLGLKAAKIEGNKQEHSAKGSSQEEEDEIEDQPPTIYRKISKDMKEDEVDKPELITQKKLDEEVKQTKDKPSIQQSKHSSNPPKSQITVILQQPIPAYFPPQYLQELTQDNLLHQFQVNVCSPSFLKFYNNLLKLSIPKELCSHILELTQKLTFGVWLKSPHIRDIMLSLQSAIKNNPLSALPLIKDEGIQNQLLENSDQEMRGCIALLLAGCIGGIVKAQGLDGDVRQCLDKMFKELPNNVAKNWLKFSQYFEFWKVLAENNEQCFEYLMEKEAISHFIDFQLEKKSPLQIYANKKYAFGNRFTQPNFTALFEVVTLLINKIVTKDPLRLSNNDRKILTDYNFLDKLIIDNNDALIKKIVLVTCPFSLSCSQKLALVLIRGYQRSSYDSLQPYLEVTHTFLTIKDDYQEHRLRWVLGYPSLCISTIDKTLSTNIYGLEDRLYTFNSTIQYDLTASLLQPLYKNQGQFYNSCALNLRALLAMCIQDPYIFQYTYKLPAPSLSHGRFIDFFNEFATGYNEEAKRYSYGIFKREELAKMILDLMDPFNKMVEEEESKNKVELKHQQKHQKNELQGKTGEQQKVVSQDWQDQYQWQWTDLQNAQKDTPDNTSEQQKDQVNESPIKNLDNNYFAVATDQNPPQEADYQQNKRPNSDNDNASTQNNPRQEPNEQYEDDDWHDDKGVKVTVIKANADEGWEDPADFDLPRRGDDADTYTQHIGAGNNGQTIYFDQNLLDKDESNKHQKKEQAVINLINVQSALNDCVEPEIYKPLAVYGSSPDELPIPCDFKYIPIRTETKTLTLTYHQSEVTFVKIRAQGKKTSVFGMNLRKLKERIPAEILKKAWKEKISGILVYNPTRDYMRLKYDYGSAYIRPSDYCWIWANEIERVWVTDRELDWPKWSLYE